ncbi:MAG: asparagine synthetase B family protein [Alphaproteobacteria bacterium]|nr:asparagine synthetase B family protein [Alphaproteobacteria bacterium]
MSFILTRDHDHGALTEAKDREGWTTPVMQFGGFCLAVADKAGFSVAQSGSRSFCLVGSIANHRELRRMLAGFNSNAMTASEAGLAALMVEHLGLAALSFIDGAFVLFCDDAQRRCLTAVIDVLGQYPLYATRGANPWMAPSPRLAAGKPGFRPDFFAPEDVLSEAPRPDDYVPIKNIIRAKPGTALELAFDGQEQCYVGTIPFHILRRRGDQRVSLDEGVRALEAMLVASITCAFDSGGRNYVPLSGGIDSGIVAAFGARVTELHTVAFGTERSNAYEPAKRVARHIGSAHREIAISSGEIIRGLFDSIYHNGIFDGSAAAVQASLFAVMAKLRGEADLVVTGHGADLLLGGTLVPGLAAAAVNRELWEQVYRTRWSGEFSPVGAIAMGMQIRHPFWTPRFLGYCLDLAGEIKVSDQDVKLVLRSFAEGAKILPGDTLRRRKPAAHHGSPVESILSGTLEIDSKPQAKSQFAYALYRRAVAGELSPATFDPEQVVAGFRQQGEEVRKLVRAARRPYRMAS